ncbi:occludin/ELL domain-containing protein 1 isoform X2 [Tamandua tetradactyla]|uniref:occludin/ELL domain-containing protein 1 isoform X2 n=1 Tax=Tamandua tetradactyla TaxID=48850 RepID=UPI0040538F87
MRLCPRTQGRVGVGLEPVSGVWGGGPAQAPPCRAIPTSGWSLQLMHNRDPRRFSGSGPGSGLLTLGQASRRQPPPRAGHDTSRRTCPPSREPRSGAARRPMPPRGPPKSRGSRGVPLPRPSGPRPPVSRGLETSSSRPLLQPQLRAQRSRPKKIVFEDELPPQVLPGTKRPTGAVPGGNVPRPQPVPDYELKYPPVSSERERSRYVAVFQDQYTDFLELQEQVGLAWAKLQQLEALLCSLPPPQSQKEAHVAAHVWREFEKKQMDPSFLDKQARCHYLKGKLRHLKMQIQKFDAQGDSEGSVYF